MWSGREVSRVLFLFCRVFFYVCLKIVKWLTEYISGFAADFSSVYANMISVEVERARTILGAPGPWAVAVAWSVDSWLSSVPSCVRVLPRQSDHLATESSIHPSTHNDAHSTLGGRHKYVAFWSVLVCPGRARLHVPHASYHRPIGSYS